MTITTLATLQNNKKIKKEILAALNGVVNSLGG